MVKRRIAKLLIGVALVVAAIGCDGAPAESPATTASPPGDGPATVLIMSSRFDPPTLSVELGSSVRFANRDGVGHTVTEGTLGRAADGAAFDEAVAGGAEVTIVFDRAGEVEITCLLHPQMAMTVQVGG